MISRVVLTAAPAEVGPLPVLASALIAALRAALPFRSSLQPLVLRTERAVP
jgi:hypothetical protein